MECNEKKTRILLDKKDATQIKGKRESVREEHFKRGCFFIKTLRLDLGDLDLESTPRVCCHEPSLSVVDTCTTPGADAGWLHLLRIFVPHRTHTHFAIEADVLFIDTILR